MSLKRIYPDKLSDPPFEVRGGCLPYAVAVLLNKESIVDQFPAKDEDGPLSHDFYHASVMYSSTVGEFCYFEVLLARSRTYDNNGQIKPPKKFVEFDEFSHSATVLFVTKSYQDKPTSKIVFLFETKFRKSVHAIGIVLDVRTGKAIVIDVQKDKILMMDIGKVFKMYNVLRVGILKYSPTSIPVYDDEFFGHLLGLEDGGSSDN